MNDRGLIIATGMRYLYAGVLVGLLVVGASCRQSGAGRQNGQVTVAAAANLIEAFNFLGPEFEARTGIHAVFSFASTAQLTRQIENSAPFDVIAAADAAHVDQLDREGLLAPGSRAVYATGVLALWIPPGSKVAVARLEDLTSPDVHIIAVAKPDLAPYGHRSSLSQEPEISERPGPRNRTACIFPAFRHRD